MNTKELAGGIVGTTLSAIGTATQTQEILQIVSLVITILGGVISFIVIPILNWYHKAKQDGKITIDEIKEGAETLEDGIEKLDDKINGKEGDKDGKNQ